MSTNLDEVIGLCRECGQTLGEAPPPFCNDCGGMERRRATNYKEKDPYRKVWNTLEDEEAELLSWVRNGTLFIPTWEELGRRYKSNSQYLLKKARREGRTPEGISFFEEAMIYRNMAKTAFDRHQLVLQRKR